MDQPIVKEHEIIYINGQKCIVRRVYEKGSSSGVGEVVFERGKPTSHDFD
jgi:vacuolar-type H+-ATPase catalytic subunit A/Vma1